MFKHHTSICLKMHLTQGSIVSNSDISSLVAIFCDWNRNPVANDQCLNAVTSWHEHAYCVSGFMSLQWRHFGHKGVSNHLPHRRLLNRLFRSRKKTHHSPASMAFVRGIHRWPANSLLKWPAKQKMNPFGDVIICRDDTVYRCIASTREQLRWVFFVGSPFLGPFSLTLVNYNPSMNK